MPERDRNNPFSPFADPNSFLGQPFLPRVAGAVSRGMEGIRRSEDRLRSDLASAASQTVSSLGGQLSTIGSVLNFPARAAQQAVSGTPLISGTALGRTRQPEAPTPMATVLPSGTPMVGFDSYPTRRAATTAPQPAAPSFQPAISQTSLGGNLLTQPTIRPTVVPFNLTQNQVIPEVPSTRPIQTPYGTIYASTQAGAGGTPNQAQAFASRTTAFEGRTPEQQQALLAQARQGGRDIAQRSAMAMTNFANRNIGSPVDLPAPQGRFGQALVGNFPRSREAIARAEQAASPTSPLASMGSAPSFPFLEERNRNPFSSIYGFQS